MLVNKLVNTETKVSKMLVSSLVSTQTAMRRWWPDWVSGYRLGAVNHCIAWSTSARDSEVSKGVLQVSQGCFRGLCHWVNHSQTRLKAPIHRLDESVRGFFPCMR
jgi:hypothetical protein